MTFTIGLDIGNHNTQCMFKRGSKGEAQYVQDQGRLLIPTAVYLVQDETDATDTKLVTSADRPAEEVVQVTGVKSLVGYTLKDLEERPNKPQQIVLKSLRDQKVKLVMDAYGEVAMAYMGRTISVKAVFADIVRNILTDAASQAGYNPDTPAAQAVIGLTIPVSHPADAIANYDAAVRQCWPHATVRITREPYAAALHAAAQQPVPELPELFVFVDVGAGTCDLAFVQRKEDVLQVLASDCSKDCVGLAYTSQVIQFIDDKLLGVMPKNRATGRIDDVTRKLIKVRLDDADEIKALLCRETLSRAVPAIDCIPKRIRNLGKKTFLPALKDSLHRQTVDRDDLLRIMAPVNGNLARFIDTFLTSQVLPHCARHQVGNDTVQLSLVGGALHAAGAIDAVRAAFCNALSVAHGSLVAPHQPTSVVMGALMYANQHARLVALEDARPMEDLEDARPMEDLEDARPMEDTQPQAPPQPPQPLEDTQPLGAPSDPADGAGPSEPPQPPRVELLDKVVDHNLGLVYNRSTNKQAAEAYILPLYARGDRLPLERSTSVLDPPLRTSGIKYTPDNGSRMTVELVESPLPLPERADELVNAACYHVTLAWPNIRMPANLPFEAVVSVEPGRPPKVTMRAGRRGSGQEEATTEQLLTVTEPFVPTLPGAKRARQV
jgi:molecular chaperone DnaK (HSP70)